MIKGIADAIKANANIGANVIIGFPGETREDLMLTIELNRKINPDSVIVNAFRPYAGTMLRKICIEKGLIRKEERAEDNRVYGAFYNGALSGEELENIRKVFALYVTFPKSKWKEIRKAEKDDVLYNKLMKEDQANRILHRKNRKIHPNNLHENIEAHEVFINDPESIAI